MRVLLSIKPEYAEKIFNGTKKFEFRKTAFTKKVEKVVVYVTAPVKQVIGEFSFGGIITDHPHQLWAETKTHAGISKDDFYNYYKNFQKGHAIEIKTPVLYPQPKYLHDFNIKLPPQSFFYL